ncbi:MAG: FAD-dependent oxidoreductase [Cyanobacteria bacterium QS_8_64_29]|nr:MAG: FAD-dependent oxidoreductase [Cyanobacteria bacterium QS_8_64_29]
MKRTLPAVALLAGLGCHTAALAASPAPEPDKTVTCDVLAVGGGLAGVATAYEALRAGKTVCLTEMTDWLGGQISAQGTSALDERTTQRQRRVYPRGYLALRERIRDEYGELNPGECWVSKSCFLPRDGHQILRSQLRQAAQAGGGELKWFPSTVPKAVDRNDSGNLIQSLTAIRHQPAQGAPPLNSRPLSQNWRDWYRYQDSERFDKTVVRFVPPQPNRNWYVVDATATGQLVGLTDVPYRLGIDPRSYREPSSSSTSGDPYCTQGFTYTFAMQATAKPQSHDEPPFYPQHAPYYSYELERLADFDLVFTYRRLQSPKSGPETSFGGISFTEPTPGDISMQNWTWGNDYRPGTAQDNLIYTREQLQARGQLASDGWMGGLRVETLRKAEQHALGFFYWLVRGTTDSQLGEGVKQPHPNNRLLRGLDSPMGTQHGLSKFPYIREGRRIIGRPSLGHPNGFTIWETDISRQDYRSAYYREAISDATYRQLWTELAGRDAIAVIRGKRSIEAVERRDRARIYPDSVGIGHYAIDFHPCMASSPPEQAQKEREGTRQGSGQAYPFQIPLRATIPQELDNLLVAGKSIATSHRAAAAYRVHSIEWSVGAAVGTAAAFALENGVRPYQLVDDLPQPEPQLQALRRRLEANRNPVFFPGTSIFNQDWSKWR